MGKERKKPKNILGAELSPPCNSFESFHAPWVKLVLFSLNGFGIRFMSAKFASSQNVGEMCISVFSASRKYQTVECQSESIGRKTLLSFRVPSWA